MHELTINPGSHLAHANLGGYLHARGDLPEAEREYRQAIAIRPQLMIPRANLIKLLAVDLADAYMKVINEAQRINQTLPPERQADLSQTYFAAGLAEMRGHRPAQAIPFLEKQLQLTPDHAGARALLEEARRQMAQ
jgi:tetratricopeptide (TPR) repeat protein